MFLKKWPPVAILDVQKSLCIAFLTISDQYHNFYLCEIFNFYKMAASGQSLAISDQYETVFFFNFYKMAAGTHFGCPKFAFLAISDRYSTFFGNSYFCEFIYKMDAGGHFGYPKITFSRISGHFRSIRNLNFFLQNGCRRPFWMSEIHFGSHLWPLFLDQ